LTDETFGAGREAAGRVRDGRREHKRSEDVRLVFAPSVSRAARLRRAAERQHTIARARAYRHRSVIQSA